MLWLPTAGGTGSSTYVCSPLAANGVRFVVEFGNTPMYVKSSPMPEPPLFVCSDAKSTAYWSLGGGCCSAPLAADSGTLNWITCRPLAQCPAVRKQCWQSEIIHDVQPPGWLRAARGSVLSTRSSVDPQIVSSPPGNAGPASTVRISIRFCPVPGHASSSTSTASPLKYADVSCHSPTCTRCCVCTALSSSDVSRRNDPSR